MPLAVVVDGRVQSAVKAADRGKSCGSRRSWAAIGSEWHALDGWGQIVETRRVVSNEVYDVTTCAEVELSPTTKAPEDRQVLVAAGSRWQAPVSAAWTPAPQERAAFARVVDTHISDAAAPTISVQCTAIQDRMRFFDVPGRGRFALGANDAGWVIAKLDGGRWSVASVHRSPVGTVSAADSGPTVCYRPIAIFDMNGDGRPEVVLRESDGPSWGDFVLSLSDDGAWRISATSPGGSTA